MSRWQSRLRFAVILLVVSIPIFLISSRTRFQTEALPLYSSSTPPLITLTNSGFDITDLTIVAGMRVSFRNSTNTPHTLVGEAGPESSLDTIYLPLIVKSANAAQPTNNEPDAVTSGSGGGGGTATGNDRCRFQVPFPPGATYTHDYLEAGDCYFHIVASPTTSGVITVNPSIGPADLSGRILDANDASNGITTPLVGATVTHLESGASTTTDSQGNFLLTNLPSGPQHFDYDGSTAAPAHTYGAYRAEQVLIAGMNNTIDRPIYIMAIDASSATQVNPNSTTTVYNPNLNVTLSIPANTVYDDDGQLYSGVMTLSEVPPDFTPGSLPDTLEPARVVTIQPMGLTFAQPVPITFPNTENLSPGSEVNIWSMDHATSQFFIAGRGRVTTNGQMIQTIEGGVREASWHFLMSPQSSGENGENGDNNKPGNEGGCSFGSYLTYNNGCLFTSIQIPPYTSLGQERAINFVYKSSRAYPFLMVPFEMTIPYQAAIPPRVSYQLSIASVNLTPQTYLNSSVLSGVNDETLRAVAGGDVSYLATGAYEYQIRQTSHYANSAVSGDLRGSTIIVNGQESKFGVGWDVAGLHRLYPQPDGSVLLVEGSGTSIHYTPILENLVISTFDTNTEGWQTVGDATPPTHMSSGGNPGGYVSAVDQQTGIFWYWKAPPGFLGDLSDAYNGTLTFDLKQSSTSSQASNQPDVILTGGNITLIYDTPNNPGTQWTPYEINLNETAGWQKSDTGIAPTQAEMQFVLSFVTDLRIRGEFRNGADTGGLDNPTISIIPENATDFQSPDGDFATIERNADGSYIYTLKDGTVYHFAPNGLQLDVVDRNGNMIAYTYDGQGRLISIVDPVGLVTTLQYAGNYLSRVIDPMGRITNFTHDTAGNLSGVSLPDGSSLAFGYDNRHLMTSETDGRGFTVNRIYNDYGQLAQAELPDGTIREATAGRLIGFVPPGQGTPTNPAPITRPDEVESTVMDGEGRTTVFDTGRFGELIQIIDPSGFTTLFDRDEDGNPIQTMLPSGTVFDRSFNAIGNMLSFSDNTVGGLTLFTYEPTYNQITSITDPFNGTTLFSYNATGNLTQVKTPLSRIVTMGYNNQGLITSLTDPLGTLTTFAYNSQGNMTSMVSGSGVNQRSVTMTYTPQGYLATLLDPLNRLFSFSYDAMGRLTQEQLPGNRTITYGYDGEGNMTSLTPPGRPAHTFTYDENGLMTAYNPPPVAGSGTTNTLYEYNFAQQLTHVTRPDGLAINYAYDTGGRLSTITQPRGVFNYSYDSNTGQLAGVTTPEGVGLAYGYNGELLTGITYSGLVPGTVGFTYDANYRITNETVNGVGISFQYNADSDLIQAGNMTYSYHPNSGLITGTTLGNVTDTWSFNPFAELSHYSASYNATGLYTVNYTRDALGRITTKIETIGGTTTTYAYTYDAAGRLETVRQNGVLIATYTYDPNGNRLTYTDSGGNVITGTYDMQDRLLSYGSNSYTYTANGELLTKTNGSGTTSYNYDVFGNLMGVTLPNGTAITYLADGQDRRVGKLVNGVLVQGFLYQDQLNPIAELDGAGNIVSRFVYGSQINVPDFMIKGGIIYRLVTDHLGSVRLVVNVQTGAIAHCHLRSQ